ncbi:MAG TPA: NAD(P)H-binding protein [Solirubrobacteraceae bacterium]|nr:NAD(P)H-binding protein [Solirubrobacteraceae bacterium]
MRILVTGAGGFVGSLLVPRLLSDGHDVRGLSRDPRRVRSPAPLARGDALTGAGLAQALEGVEVAYYLIHSMERTSATTDPFEQRDRLAAETFAAAARAAGVGRIVYLGGLLDQAHRSRHLSSRHEVERILVEHVPDSIVLRASIVIGARSRSFRLLVHLVERMRVLALPAWRRFRTQPIDERDVTELLLAAATAPLGGDSLDIGGRDVLSYGEMIERIAELMLVSRPALGFGVSATALTARVAAAIAGEDPELVVPLMQSLQGDLLPADDHAAELLGVDLHTFDSAVEHALSDWESTEPLAAR